MFKKIKQARISFKIFTINLLPLKSYLTKTNANISPITTFIMDAIKAVEMLTKYPDSTLGLVTVYTNSEKLNFAEKTTSEQSGINTTMLSIVIVIPNEIPKPGITLFLFFILLVLSTKFWNGDFPFQNVLLFTVHKCCRN